MKTNKKLLITILSVLLLSQTVSMKSYAQEEVVESNENQEQLIDVEADRSEDLAEENSYVEVREREEAIAETSSENTSENTVMPSEETRCDMIIQGHIDVVKKSDDFIFSLARKNPVAVTPVDVIALKNNLVERYQHLYKTLKEYNDENKPCGRPVVAKALVVFDYHHFGKSALTSGHIRRAIKSLTKYEDYGLSKLEKNYKKAVSTKNLKKIRKEIEQEMNVLPEKLEMSFYKKPTDKGYFFNLADSVMGATSKSMSRVAYFWGVLSDHLKWRNGRIYQSDLAKGILLENLKPLDIIFEKRTFVLSNYTIPGHWGHVAVYLGKKDKLIEMGVWDKPEFEFFRQKVEEGYEIVEIRKTGMNFVKLDDFLNLDEIAVMRMREFSIPLEEVFSNLANQAKKKYDFQFNAHSTHEITCTELITNSYGNIDWKQSKNLGYVNMQPDDIAELSLREEKKADMILYLKGKKKYIEVEDEKAWNDLF